MADFQLTQGKAAPFAAAVTKAGDATQNVDVDSISWTSDGAVVGVEGSTDQLTVQARGVAAGVGSLIFNARRVSDGLVIVHPVSVEVPVPVEPAPVVTITKGEEV